MRTRIRGPTGQATINLPETATVGDLLEKVTHVTSITDFEIKYGYPPKTLPLKEYDSIVKLSKLGIKLDGEQLIVSASSTAAKQHASTDSDDKASPSRGSNPTRANGDVTSSISDIPSSFSFANHGSAPPPKPQTPSKPLSLSRKSNLSNIDAPEVPLPTHAATLILRIMPDDNSCLFRAFSTAFFGTDIDSMHELRSIIAQYIQSHQDRYSAVVLEKTPEDYCRWIQTEDAWGGAIELDILSRHFDVEICSIDVQTLRTDRFNEGRPTRCILVYSGIHYDTIALTPSDEPHDHAHAPPEFDTKIFNSEEEIVLQTAVDLCSILQRKHYYTDTASFSIRCNVCRKTFIGEKGATEHASETGHYDFGEAG